MSLEEARKVPASFSEAAFVPPPRTINDITAMLESQERADPAAAIRAREEADAAPPGAADHGTLGQFYFRRGLAAREIGRSRQEIDDLTKASQYARSAFSSSLHEILSELGNAHLTGGRLSAYIEYKRRAIEATPSAGHLLGYHAALACGYSYLGDLKAADAALAETSRFYYESLAWTNQRPKSIAGRYLGFAHAQAVVLEARGNYADAEPWRRKAIAALTADPVYSRSWRLDEQHHFFARNLINQGRLIEAENEARMAVLGALAKRGRYSPFTARMLQFLVEVLLQQGRYRESEALARAVVDIHERTEAAADSFLLARIRGRLARALVLQHRFAEALVEFERSHAALRGDPEALRAALREPGENRAYITALLGTGQVDRAIDLLRSSLEQSSRLVGEAHRDTAEIRASLAVAYAARGEAARALREFRAATPLLLGRSADKDDEATRPLAADQQLADLLGAYVRLLADIKGTPLERAESVDASGEAFRLADVARGRSVQRALNASAARAAARSPALADLVRREQDARRQINALYALLGTLIGQPGTGHDAKVAADLGSRIETLRRALEALTRQIEKDFPAYADLIDPKPVTVGQVQAMLRPGEALIATLVVDDRTFVWAVPPSGAAVLATASIGARELEEAVAKLRKAVEPRAKTLGDIPEFDVDLAQRLFRVILEPVRSGWQDARSLLVVAHGPLAQLPIAFLPTKPVARPPESGAIFSPYREVPWLVRSHAVTMLPSVGSLAALRAMPARDPGRRAFVGFGDPYFSTEQAAAAETSSRSGVRAPDVLALTTRAAPITFRSAPEAFDSAQLAKLPRLPETAAEIRSLAASMDAEPSRDVFLGARANERAVKTLELARYRVIAFATHGLVPGDLDGLTQPALALSAPRVAGVDGDGLLTMDEIMALRLDADWVVLSACNTASGRGAGAEAVSGLGRAFFYAGARALLVSNWPVETTSARALTTDLFRRQRQHPGLSRAEALQQTLNWLIDRGELVDADSGKVVFSYAHPIFWAPFTLIGDGGG
jgi:CHAT domain-containing protein